MDTKPENAKKCSMCGENKECDEFVKNKNVCKACNNLKRRTKYQYDEEHRKALIRQATIHKHNKVLERRQMKLDEIGEGNKKCSVCLTIKEESNFRHNRLRCRNCERDDPVGKFQRIVRARIWYSLSVKKLHTIEYLGCSSTEYLQWMTSYDEKYTLDNRGEEWHIDHVIPLSKFDLENESEQMIAFNWRNTMPLPPKENLSKNNKIIPQQIEQHLQKLIVFHKEKNIEFPQIFIDLFAKHLVVGNPLKPSLPL